LDANCSIDDGILPFFILAKNGCIRQTYLISNQILECVPDENRIVSITNEQAECNESSSATTRELCSVTEDKPLRNTNAE
jgi:hypothetical protein